MERNTNSHSGGSWRSRLPILVPSAAAVVFSIICLVTGFDLQVLFLGWLVCLVLWASLMRLLAETERPTDLLGIPFAIAKDREMTEQYKRIGQNLISASLRTDSIYRMLALTRITQLADDVEMLASGNIVFETTESWRLAYEQLLRSPGLNMYRSVALVQTANYWQDEPGRRSMQVNYEMQAGGSLSVERIVILADRFWPAADTLPLEPLLSWIDEQHRHGIWIQLVRESALLDEPDLGVDFGIYGNRAVGIQELNPQAKTIRFILVFDFEELLRAENRWERLSIHAVPYRELLDRSSD